jgi:hypothetical protein
VVALSSLAAFSNKYMEQADNAVLLDNIFRHLACPRAGGGKPPAGEGAPA